MEVEPSHSGGWRRQCHDTCTGEVLYTKTLFLSRPGVLQERLSGSYFACSSDTDESLPFLNVMVENHRKCPYWTLLKRLAPSILDEKLKRTTRRRGQQRKRITSQELLDNSVDIGNVYLYLRCIFLKVVPYHVLGSSHNRNHFLKQLKKLLSIGCHGQMSLHYVVEGIKTKHISWLHAYDQKQKKELLKKCIHFLITNFAGALIQSFFYISDSTSFKNRLFFYRKKIWHRLIQIVSSKLPQSWRLKKVPEIWVENKLKDNKCLGVSKVRFLVKSRSLRPIVNLSASYNKRASVNKHLKTLLQVLTFEKDRNGAAFGATIMKVDDIHLKWKAFTSDIHYQNISALYFVKVDIEKCFETINPCLLYGIVKRILSQPYYKIYKYKKCLHKNGPPRYMFSESLEHPHKVCSAAEQNIEPCGSYEVSREVLMDKLCALLFCNLLKLGRQYYVQTIGISQGSALSSILCGAYYGYMERTILNGVIGKQDLLVRMVDDMLYVTPWKNRAKKFLRTMLDGIPQFNCRCNLGKCMTNFEYNHPVYGNVLYLSDQRCINYCGLSFDIETLNVHLDFSNYENVQTKDTVSCNLIAHPGLKMREKILRSVRPKCASILFDTAFNSLEVIQSNVLCIFAVCVVKFHCLVLQFPPKRRVLSNPEFFIQIIQCLPTELINFVVKSYQKVSTGGAKFTFPVPTAVVNSLCYQTFLFKLRQHYNMYSPVVEILKQLVKDYERVCDASRKLPQIFHEIHLK